MNVKIEIHNNNIIEKKFKGIKNWKVPESTKQEIKLFIEKAKIGQVNEGMRLSEATLSKYLSTLRHSLEIINKQTSKITKADIEKFDKKITGEGLKSIYNYRRDLKTFLIWKVGEAKTKKLAGWLDLKKRKKTPDYLTEQEITKLFKSCKNAFERYLIAVLFDSGSRIEEFCNIRYEDIQLPEGNSTYPRIVLKEEYSKTKGRNISLYWKYSLEAVRDFLKERESEGIKSDEQVSRKEYDAIRMFLFRLGKRVLNKKVYPHLFRHSSATFYAPKLNRQELCYRYGWRFSSEMPDIYISRAGMESRELDEKFQSTEIEDLRKRFEEEKFEREKEVKELQRAFALIYEEVTGKKVIEITNDGMLKIPKK